MENTSENTAETEEITVNGVKTQIDLKSLTLEQLKEMTPEQIAEAKKAFGNAKKEIGDVGQVFKAYANAKFEEDLQKIKSIFGRLKTFFNKLDPVVRYVFYTVVLLKLFVFN